ncbi:MAG: DUF4397 domain-containing protein [Chitinophaga sp.]|uniref:DUF4397 domain-containing protein n=1 Tax=Chitinophaga sp. TaxID=1869181 RepID=UPI001B1E4168|nr:DUF4397 domain-containing protein [Chitinophaga sp.]MBO9731288.1 DUF4397 domain-containing protein [Chitinophaga sp.]
MNKTATKYFYHTVWGLMLLLATACSKDKTDAHVGHEPDYSNMAKSTVRLVTFNGNVDVMVNDVKVTNWYVPQLNDPVLNPPYPTQYFSSGKLSGTWYVPQQFLDAKGQAVIKTGSPAGGGEPVILSDSFNVQDDYYQPSDYYLATSVAQSSTGTYTATRVPRTTILPADPSHIRIRLVNLCNPIANGGIGTLTLAYADGSPINKSTSGIASHAWSDYIELPYGTYQFKVLIDGTDLQIPGKPALLTNVTSPDNYSLGGTQVYYSPVQTFQPGGVYTIAAGLTGGAYQYGEYPLMPNCFSVITDIDPPVNITYGRVQVVNAATGNENGVKVQIDNLAASSVSYGKAGEYITLVAGRHHIKITGSSVVEKDIDVRGGDNLTIWAWPAADNTLSLTVTANNMGGTRIRGGNADGSDATNNIYDPLKFNMLLQTRFLNLCPDLPDVTFTNTNGALFPEDIFAAAAAAQHLRPGQAADPTTVPYPYADLKFLTGGNVQAYSSQPGVLPGNRLTGVSALTPIDFVRMPAHFFQDGNYGSEPGVYTVALVGRNAPGKTLKMIVIKHNQ